MASLEPDSPLAPGRRAPARQDLIISRVRAPGTSRPRRRPSRRAGRRPGGRPAGTPPSARVGPVRRRRGRTWSRSISRRIQALHFGAPQQVGEVDRRPGSPGAEPLALRAAAATTSPSTGESTRTSAPCGASPARAVHLHAAARAAAGRRVGRARQAPRQLVETDRHGAVRLRLHPRMAAVVHAVERHGHADAATVSATAPRRHVDRLRVRGTVRQSKPLGQTRSGSRPSISCRQARSRRAGRRNRSASGWPPPCAPRTP